VEVKEDSKGIIESKMATIVAPTAPIQAAAPKKAKAAKTGAKPKKPSTHPAWAVMLQNAVKALNERGGSSIPAIKKYILANYQVDPDKVSPHMKRGMKAALTAGTLSQVKGKGMSGSFKLGGSAKAKAAKPKVAKKPAGEKKKVASPKKKSATPKKAKPASGDAKPKKVKKSPAKPKAAGAAKKPASPKKAGAKPKVAKKPASPKKAGTPKKAKVTKPKTAKAPKTPKAPKPKTTKKVTKTTPKPKKAAAAPKKA
jgi:hypothetical protein